MTSDNPRQNMVVCLYNQRFRVEMLGLGWKGGIKSLWKEIQYTPELFSLQCGLSQEKQYLRDKTFECFEKKLIA